MRHPVVVTLTAEATAGALAAYPVAADCYDEAVAPDGALRPASRPALELLAATDLDALGTRLAGDVEERGVCFNSVDGTRGFVLDPVPRVVEAEEWAVLEAGLVQRVRALDAFVDDAYNDRRIVEAGVVPLEAIEGCAYYEPSLRGHRPPGGAPWVGISGLDLVRGPDGRFAVLEDNLRTPSGMAYARVARQILAPLLAGLDPAPRPLDGLVGMLQSTLYTAAPPDAREGDGPFSVLLTDGRDNAAFFEHQWLARQLRVPLVEPHELETRGGRLWLHRRGERDLRPVDVVYRRSDQDRAGSPMGELLLEPWKRGTLGLVNAYGNGVADDKLVHGYVEAMVRFYLGEAPLMPSVPTYDLSRPEVLAEQLPRLSELVVKPRAGHGGVGIVIGPHATREAVARVTAAVRERPHDFVAQELVALSRHPTAINGRLEPRHVDLRPFVFHAGERVAVLPGGLTRVAFTEGSLVVNSSQNGGAKDTWVL